MDTEKGPPPLGSVLFLTSKIDPWGLGNNSYVVSALGLAEPCTTEHQGCFVSVIIESEREPHCSGQFKLLTFSMPDFSRAVVLFFFSVDPSMSCCCCCCIGFQLTDTYPKQEPQPNRKKKGNRKIDAMGDKERKGWKRPTPSGAFFFIATLQK